jgi:glycosyltransferase involved in cell wall biosynthesis
MPDLLPFPVTSATAFESEGPEMAGTCVTVVVNSYNYDRHLLETLASVSAQTHDNLELIIVDDHSSDRSLELAKGWMADNQTRFWRAKLLVHDQNYGLFQTRNTGFEHASAEYIFSLDSDNILYPRAIGKMLAGCVNAAAQAAYSQLEFFDEVSQIGCVGVWDPVRLAQGNYIDAMALIKKSAWHSVGGYSRLIRPGFEDYDLWCKFVRHGFYGVFIPEVLCRYRVHGDSMLRQMSEQDMDESYCEMIVRHPWLRL